MSYVCCSPCRLRFTPAAAAYITACPECGNSPQAIATLERSLGFRLVGPEDLPMSSPRIRNRDHISRAGRSTIVTDSHIRILRLIAHQRQRELRNHDAADHNGDAISTDRRQNLERAATRTRARVADAQTRRRQTRTRGHMGTVSDR